MLNDWADKAAARVINELRDRGCDDYFGNMDNDVFNEVREAIACIIRKAGNNEGSRP